jgi:hypothetical protein
MQAPLNKSVVTITNESSHDCSVLNAWTDDHFDLRLAGRAYPPFPGKSPSRNLENLHHLFPNPSDICEIRPCLYHSDDHKSFFMNYGGG